MMKKSPNKKNIKNGIRQIIKNNNTNLQLETDEGDLILYSTNKYGDADEKMYSDIDYEDALNIKNKVLGKYSDYVDAKIETTDEWVSLNIVFI